MTTIPTFTKPEEVKNYFIHSPKGTECYLENDSNADNVKVSLRGNHGIYANLTTIQANRYHLKFDHYNPHNPDHTNNDGTQPTWKDIKDSTKIGDTVYVVTNRDGLKAKIAKHWGGGMLKGAASITKCGIGYNVTRLK